MQTPELPHGTLDLLILNTLETMGPFHGYALARRIEQLAGATSRISQGSIYPALIRLEQRRLVATKWGLSETNRRIKIYALTKLGAKQLAADVKSWEQSTALVAKCLEAKP